MTRKKSLRLVDKSLHSRYIILFMHFFYKSKYRDDLLYLKKVADSSFSNGYISVSVASGPFQFNITHTVSPSGDWKIQNTPFLRCWYTTHVQEALCFLFSNAYDKEITLPAIIFPKNHNFLLSRIACTGIF